MDAVITKIHSQEKTNMNFQLNQQGGDKAKNKAGGQIDIAEGPEVEIIEA